VERLEISNDDFIRTTSHATRRVSEIIRRINERGDIYKGSYEGWYSSGEEAFVPDSQVATAATSRPATRFERLSEPILLPVSAWQDRLLAWYGEPDCIRPQSRYNEVVSFVSSGLKDLSISRARCAGAFRSQGRRARRVRLARRAHQLHLRLGFGGDDQRLFDEFWPATLPPGRQDILRFHCVYCRPS